MQISKILSNSEIIFETFENRFFEKVDINSSMTNDINSLVNSNILIKESNKIYINFNYQSNVYLKKLIDQTKFEQIDQKLQKEILYINNLLFKENRNKIFSIFLIGSVARNTYSDSSDLDLVIIHSGDKIKLPSLVNKMIQVQFITYSKTDFRLKNIERDEILIWALKYGLLIYDRNYLFKKTNAYTQHNDSIILKKRSQIDYICNTFETMLNEKTEYTKGMYSVLAKLLHLVSRYIILINEDFPLSRPELKDQVQQYDNNIISIYEALEKENLSRDYLINTYFSLKKYFKDFTVIQ